MTSDGVTVVPTGLTAMVETAKTEAMEQACQEIFDLNQSDTPVSVGLANLTTSPIDIALQSVEDGQLGPSRSLRPDSTYALSAVWSTLDGYKAEVNFPGWIYVATASNGNCLVFNDDGSITTLTTTEATLPTNEQLCTNILNPNDGFSVRVRMANLTSSAVLAERGDGDSFEVNPYRTSPYYDANPGDVIKLNLLSGPFEYTVGDSNGCIVIRDDGATVVR